MKTKSKPDTYETECNLDITVEYEYFPPVWGPSQAGSGGLYLEPRPTGQVRIYKILSKNGVDITDAFTPSQLEELEDEIGGEHETE